MGADHRADSGAPRGSSANGLSGVESIAAKVRPGVGGLKPHRITCPADHPDYVADVPFATAVVFLDQRPTGQRESDRLTSRVLKLRPASGVGRDDLDDARIRTLVIGHVEWLVLVFRHSFGCPLAALRAL